MEDRTETLAMGWPDGRWERNVMLVAPGSREREFDCCVDLLTPDEPEDLNVLSLDLVLPPDARLRMWAVRRDARPGEFLVVSGQPLPHGTAEDRARELGFDRPPGFVSLEDPRNLTRLGVELTESLRAWEGGDDDTVVCFNSLTALLQHVPVERAYRFLHSFTNQVRAFDAMAHYHVNPRAHDQRDVERLVTLFDGVLDPGER